MLIEFLGLKKHGIPHVHKIFNFILQIFKPTSGCPWPKATVKSPVGARRRPLWSPPWVPVTFGHYEVL
jgi:hypothetical protein